MINLKEQWVQFYELALMELEHAKITGRISDARTAIFERFEALHDIPELHQHEREAIADALRSLSFLERDEERYQHEEKQRLLDESLQKLRRIAPTIQNLDDKATT